MWMTDAQHMRQIRIRLNSIQWIWEWSHKIAHRVYSWKLNCNSRRKCEKTAREKEDRETHSQIEIKAFEMCTEWKKINSIWQLLTAWDSTRSYMIILSEKLTSFMLIEKKNKTKEKQSTQRAQQWQTLYFKLTNN